MTPIGDHILVTPIAEDAVWTRADGTKSSLVIPEIAQDKPNRGIIASVGEGRVLTDGTLRRIKLSKGDRVLFSKYAGNEFSSGGQQYIVISYDDVLVVLD